MKRMKKIRSNLAFNIIGAVVFLLFLFSVIVSAIGFISFTNSLKREYTETTYHMAKTATMLVDGDKIDSYLKNGADESYELSRKRLDIYCDNMHVSLIYIIKVDTSDYGRFNSVFNSVDNKVDNTDYVPWELGFARDTTNDEYREKYKKIYEGNSEYESVFRTSNLNGKQPHITMLVPLKTSDNKVSSILCVQRPMSELSRARLPYLINVAISAVLLAVSAALIATFYFRREFVNPLRKVSNETIRFAAENKKGEPLGEVSKINEISLLASSIDTMEVDMLRYIDNLTAITAEKERIGAELSIASTIQRNSVPSVFPAFPERKEFDIFASMTPAKEVGGDFYNFFLIDDNHLAMVMADVSGKGIPAALFMMVTNILISDRTQMGGTPAEILSFVNDNICQHNDAEMFVTVWLGILEISTGKVIAANAGHEDPIIYRNGKSFELEKTKHGFVIGGMEGIKYRNHEFTLGKGDKLFLYTDGVPEANNEDNELFSLEKTIEALNLHKNDSPEGVLDGINRAVGEFVGVAPQFDDLTMMCLEYRGTDSMTVDADSLTVDARVENLNKVISYVKSVAEENNANPMTVMQLELSVEEIFVNIANYAYDGEGKAEVDAKCSEGVITIIISDSGKPYNPLENKDPDITLPVEERQIGGLGIFLTKKSMDEVEYEYRDGKNVLTMRKKL